MSLKTKLSDKSPQIFMAAGVISFIGAVVTAAMKADKVKPIFKEAKEEFKAAKVDEKRYGFKNKTEENLYKAKVVGKATIDICKELRWPIALTTVGVLFELRGFEKLSEEKMALASKIDILGTSYGNLKQAIEEEADEEVANKINDNVRSKGVAKRLKKLREEDFHVSTNPENYTYWFSADSSNKYPGGADTVFPFSNLKKPLLISCYIFVVSYLLPKSLTLLAYLKTMRQNAAYGSRMAARTLSILVLLALITLIMMGILIGITV